MSDIKEHDFKKILITKEFLQLYFMNSGANPRLNVNSITDLYDLLSKKNKEKFHFAIIRIRNDHTKQASKDHVNDDLNDRSEKP